MTMQEIATDAEGRYAALWSDLESQAAVLQFAAEERRERLQLDDLTGGGAVPEALDHAAGLLDSVRSIDDVLALFGVLPGFLRMMAGEARADYALVGGV